MDLNFETVLLDLHPVVKVESIDIDDTYQPTTDEVAENQAKIGEIFHLRKDHFKFVCIRCSAEFSLFSQFTTHAEKHLTEIYVNSVDAKFENDFDVADVKPPISELSPSCKEDTSWSNANAFEEDDENGHPITEEDEPTVGKAKTYWCSICGVNVLRKGPFMEHMRQQHQAVPKTKIPEKGRTYSCRVCHATVAYRKSMLRHIKNAHPSENVYSFDIIKDVDEGASARSKEALDERCIEPNVAERKPKTKIAEKGRTYVCRICSATVSYRKSIIRHMKNAHPTSDVHEFDVLAESGPVKISRKPITVRMKLPDELSQKKKDSVRAKDSDPAAQAKIPDEPKTYVCRICSATMHRKKDIISHIRRVHPTDDVSAFDIINHMPKTKIAEKGRLYACKICRKTFSYRKSVIRHIKNAHPTESMYEFEIINDDHPATAINLSENSLPTATKENRVAYPRKDQTYECYLCHTAFTDWPDVRTHFRKLHYNFSVYRTNYFNLRTCKICNEEFRDAYLFEKHKRWHKKQSDYRPHQCHLCETAYRERHELKRHLARHVRDFTCEICHKSYSQLNKVSHMRRHTGENRVQCDECGQFFAAPDKLKRHMRTHTGERPYECEFCHKRFRQSYGLAVHKRTHTGEYIHYCKSCKKGFGARRELKKHNLRAHGIEMVDESKAVLPSKESAD